MISLTSLKPRHSLDNELLVITGLYLTQDHELMVMGHCSKCLVDVTLLISLVDLHDNCPGPPDFGEADQLILHSLGIILPDAP